MSNSSAKENVVVLGGGLGGSLVAKELSGKLDHSKYNLIVVEARPYLIWLPGGVRMAVTSEKEAVDTYTFNYDKLLPTGKGSVKKAKVQKIVPNSDGNGGELELVGGETLSYRSSLISVAGGSRSSDVFSVSQSSCWRLDPSGLVPSTIQRATRTFVSSCPSGSSALSPRRIL